MDEAARWGLKPAPTNMQSFSINRVGMDEAARWGLKLPDYALKRTFLRRLEWMRRPVGV